MQRRVLVAVTFVTAMLTAGHAFAFPAEHDREAVLKLVAQVQRADYKGDRPALHRLYADLSPFTANKDLASRVEYWRGFALWRSVFNGFNDNANPSELQQDAKQAVEAFDKSLAADPSFVDSKIGIASCLGLLAYSFGSSAANQAEQQQYVARTFQAVKDARAAAPDNPRLLWILGPVFWNIPVDRGGGQDKAIETYKTGLETIRSHKNATNDSLDPSWGEPELLMSLGWSYLNRKNPDVAAAEQNATSALQLVPYWHYVRDILMKQIRDAKAKPAGNG